MQPSREDLLRAARTYLGAFGNEAGDTGLADYLVASYPVMRREEAWVYAQQFLETERQIATMLRPRPMRVVPQEFYSQPASSGSLSDSSNLSDNNSKTIMKRKTKHLTRSERMSLHSPAPDVIVKGNKEYCKSACALEIADIISKFK
jgi:hypothetical protein